MDESLVTGPVVFWERLRQRDLELEVREFFFDLSEVIDVEQFTQASTTVPVRHLSVGLLAFEQFKNVTSQRCHSSTTTDVDHFGFGVFDKELAVRSADGGFITRFQIENPTAHLARRCAFGGTRRWRCNADVQHDDAFFTRIVRHRIRANDFFIDLGHVAPNVVLVPVFAVLFFDVKVFVVDGVRWAFNLNVPPGTEINLFAFGQLQHELFDERRHVPVAFDFADPFLGVESFRWNFDFHVLSNGNLATQAFAFGCVFLGDVTLFCRQDIATSAVNFDQTLRTGATTTAGARNKDACVSQCTKQFAAGWNLDLFLFVDHDLDWS